MSTRTINTDEPAWVNKLPMVTLKAIAAKHSLNHALLAAVCMTESSGNTLATRFEPKWKYFVKIEENAKRVNVPVALERQWQATSWGLCQVMGSVARELGYQDHLKKLMIPSIGLQYGARKLSLCLRNSNGEWDIALACYNGGTARRDEFGELEDRLQDYVNKVHEVLQAV